jgi:FtsP/CotA-like multicopper oxidase with cupredoxin domain
MRRALLHAVAASLLLPSLAFAIERIAPNDNRHAAGVLKNGALELSLEIRNGQWYPESDSGASVQIEAFAESGKPLTVPGPLVRVVEGTTVNVTLRNTLAKSARVFGLHNKPDNTDDGILIAAGQTAKIQFTAGKPGTYYYWATTTDRSLATRDDIDSQLSGAIVVDPKVSARKDDRVFVIGIWFEPKSTANGVDKAEREVLVINGKSWPNTERFNFTVGDTVRWRWVNPTTSTHPMHLHGFYYDVLSRGGMNADTLYSDSERRLVNTELMQVGSTMTISFVPKKPGNWVFHCHFAFHVSEDAALVPPQHAHDSTMQHRMAGLVLGMHVNPKPGEQYALDPMTRRNIRLLIQSSPRRFGNKPAYGFVVQNGSTAPAKDSVVFPSPTLVLKRGEPVRITVVNNLNEPSSVHWHGIELESFPDGVPNWSGIGTKLMKPIAPKDSFIADFTPPRSGTFMYHSHLNEGVQINSGMYGALVVMDDPSQFNPERDKVFLVGGAGPLDDAGFNRGMVNGTLDPDGMTLQMGETYRFRFINIHPEWRVEFSLGTDTTTAKWKPVAKDGADLPLSQRTVRAAYLLTGPGETADFEYMPTEPGPMRLTVKTRVSGWIVPVNIMVRR